MNILTIQVNTTCGSQSNHGFPYCRVLMANINDDMANEDLNRVKFLLSSTLSHEQMEKAKVKKKKMNEVLFSLTEFSILVCVGGELWWDVT